MRLVLSRSVALACDPHRFNSIQFCKQESSPITLKMLTADLSIRKVLPYSYCVLNAWVWQRRGRGGMECQILHRVFTVSLHMLFRDSWQQTSSGYEAMKGIFLPPWNFGTYPISRTVCLLIWEAFSDQPEMCVPQQECLSLKLILKWIYFCRWVLIHILNVSTINSALEVNRGE